jgi:hypothetical protein
MDHYIVNIISNDEVVKTFNYFNDSCRIVYNPLWIIKETRNKVFRSPAHIEVFRQSMKVLTRDYEDLDNIVFLQLKFNQRYPRLNAVSLCKYLREAFSDKDKFRQYFFDDDTNTILSPV